MYISSPFKLPFLFLLTVIFLNTNAQNYVEQNGKLQIIGHQLCNEKGKPIQLKGFSTHNTTYCPECVTRDAIKSNKEFWGANVVRAAIYVDDWWNKRSYHDDPEFSKAMVDSLVRWTEEFGIYCIIDWHILTKGNPNAEFHSGADAFFEEMSSKYAQKKHVLYEICNEPNAETVTWDTIADYANRIMPIIKENDPDAIVIIGTPKWCQDLESVEPWKLMDTTNVMYAFHFYAASHVSLLEMFEKEIHRIPIFATEWGVCTYTGNGDINFENTEKFLNAMYEHVQDGDTVQVSWCNFSYGDKKEAASVLKPESCINQQWENMTPTGFFMREQLHR